MKSLLFALMLTVIPSTPTLLPSPMKSGKAVVYVGTFRGESSKGIYAFRFDSDSGEMSPLGLVGEASRPLFLALHPSHRFLYAISRPSPVDRKNIGVVLAYAIDLQTAKLTALNSQRTSGIDPAYVSLDQTGQNLFVANFGSNSGEGAVSIFPIKKDGSLGEESDVIRYSGVGVHPQRQLGPHSHGINVSPDNRFVFVTDLGLDKVFVYHFDPQRGKLTPNVPAFATLHPGSGPRHLLFHPNGHFVYVVSEIQSTITAFAYDSKAGALRELQTITTLPTDFAGTSSAAEVQVHPNGKFLYASNRGHDSIAVYAIDPKVGTLSLIELVPAQGKTPAQFSLDPSGSWLISANQGSDALVLFRIDPATGRLQSTGKSFALGTPSCVKFLQLK